MKKRTFSALIFAFAACCAVILSACAPAIDDEPPDGNQERSDSMESPRFRIEYAEDTIAVRNPDVSGKSADDASEQARKTVGLEYERDAYSADGRNFECYVANAARNSDDMFIIIYADAEMTDELFLSGLIPPGRAFDRIALNRPLEPGAHTLYVAFVRVEEVDGERIARGQALVTMEFRVGDSLGADTTDSAGDAASVRETP